MVPVSYIRNGRAIQFVDATFGELRWRATVNVDIGSTYMVFVIVSDFDVWRTIKQVVKK